MSEYSNEYRICEICSEQKLLTIEFFRKRNTGTFRWQCKDCERNRVRIRSHERRQDPITRAIDYERTLNSHYKYRDERTAKMRDYYNKNAGPLREYARNYYYDHKEVKNAYSREYQRQHKVRLYEIYKIYIIQYRRTERGRLKLALARARYRARKLALPFDFSLNDWLCAKAYFGHRCAVCGASFKAAKPNADHWIALSDPRLDNPGTVATNIVPLCSQTGGCNQSKGNRPAIEWLNERFGETEAQIVIARIEAYFEWVKQQR